MQQSAPIKSPYPADSEKTTPVMVYTQNLLIRGQVITKESIRVSIWLRTQGAPEYIRMKNVQIVIFGGNGPLQTQTFGEYYIPTSQVLAFHIVPPAKDEIDYDETEKNRMMVPLTFLIGTFRLNGLMRISANTDISSHLSIVKSPLVSIYELDISNPALPTMGTLHVPMALIRPSVVSFGCR